MRRFVLVGALALILAMATAACAGSRIPATSPDAVGTIVAATMRAITPAASATTAPPTAAIPTSPIPATPLPTLPPVIPTVIIPGATRITFRSGATTEVVSDTLQAGQSANYVLQASQGQLMMVNVDSPNHDVTLSIKTQGGTSLLNAATKQATWQMPLPQTEDYYLTLHGGASTGNFTMTVTIPSRIKFAEGADSIKISGRTVAGYNVLYAAFATKGQKMSVSLNNLSDEAALTIYGYTDGTPYVRYVSEQTSFSFALPLTQDYIIEVVPKAGREVSYVLLVKIQ